MLPDPPTQLVVGYLQSRLAYRIAQQQVAEGVHPKIAAEHAERASSAIYFFWIGIVGLGSFWALIVLAFAGTTPTTFVWLVVSLPFVVVLGRRSYVFRDTRGDLMLKYLVPTPLVVVLGALWVYVVGLVIVIAALI